MTKKQRGDTIVEVMVAFSVFTLLAVGAITVMNRGLSLAQQSLEVTLVRQQIDGQAELLRYARDTEPGLWQSIRSSADTSTPSALTALTACPANGGNVTDGGISFILGVEGGQVVRKKITDAGTFQAAETYSRVDTQSLRSQGLWVTPVKVSAASGDAYDMYINSCWDAPGSKQPMTLRTIVRLYET